MDTTKRALPVLGIAVACLLAGSAGGAVAGRLVSSADIKDGTVRSVDLQNHGVQRVDLGNEVVDRLGAVTGYRVKAVTGDDVANGVQDGFAVSCPPGRALLGASGYWLNDDRAPQVYQVPNDPNTAAILSTNRSGDTDSLTLIVSCATAGPGVLKKSIGGVSLKPAG